MLEDALEYPFRGEDAATRLLVGGALPFLGIAIYLVGLLLVFLLVGIFVLPLAIVPRVFLWGYLVAVVAAVLAGNEEPPGFDDWKRLGVDGLKAVLVSIGYSLPLVLFVVALGVVAAVTGAFAEQANTAAASAVGVLLVGFALAAAIYSLLLYYLLPAAIVNMVRADDVAAAFHLRTVRDVAFDGDYLVAWLLAAVVLVVGSLVALPLYLVLVGFVVRFYTLVVAAYLVTRGSMASMGWSSPVGARDAALSRDADSPASDPEAGGDGDERTAS